jgi:ABC-type nitrate/sulfonate/bicarbonate transport system permease component
VGLKITGPLPSPSAERFRDAFSDTHVAGLVEHCVEVMVWRRTAMGFAVGALAGTLLGLLIH